MPSATSEPSRQAECHRFFFALKPDADMARRTRAFAEDRLGVKGLLRAEHLHVTLALTEDFADVPAALIAALHHAGDAVRSAPFDLRLDRLTGSRRSISLRPSATLPALFALQAAIADGMTRVQVTMRRDWSFTPHETLAHRKGAPFEQRVEGFQWPVTDFVLVHSHVGLNRHDVIGRWLLGDDGPA